MLSPKAQAAGEVIEAATAALEELRRHRAVHPRAAEALDQASQRLDSFTEQFGDLELNVRSQGLLLGDEPLLSPEEELAQILLEDGFTQLTLERATSAAWREFLQLLAGRDLGGGEGLLISELWARRLPGLDYKIYDPLAPTATRIFQQYDPLQLGPLVEHLAELVEEVATLMPVAAEALGQSAPSRWRRSNPEVRAEFAHEIDLARGIEIACWAGQPDRAPPLSCCRFLAEAALEALGQEGLSRAVAILKRSREFSLPLPEIQEAVTSVLGGEIAMAYVSRALESASSELSPDELIETGLEFFDYLSDTAVPAAVSHYPRLDDGVRRVFRRFLTTRAETQAAAIAPLSQEPAPVGREAIGILALGSAESQARQLLQELARSEGTEAAAWAQEALAVVTGDRRREQLAEQLESKDRRERLHALKQIRSGAAGDAFEQLDKVVLGSAFQRRDEEEVQATLEALVSQGGLRAVRPLQELAQRRLGLFGRKKGESIRDAATYWLRKLKRER